MPRLSKRDRAIRQMQEAATGVPGPGYELYQRFLECPELHAPSRILAAAFDRLDVDGQPDGAFSARTYTPIAALPGWLPPPI